MAAAPFTGTLKLVGANGKVLYYRCSMSDVAAASWTFPGGGTILQVPGDQPYWLKDLIIITGGTDTTNSEVFSNELSTGIYLDHKSNLNTVQNRMLQFDPIKVNPGSQLKFIQRA